jgi:hypothetical protein
MVAGKWPAAMGAFATDGPQHQANHMGIGDSKRLRTGEKVDVDAKDDYWGQTPLWWATALLCLLLTAEISATGKSIHNSTIIFTSVRSP